LQKCGVVASAAEIGEAVVFGEELVEMVPCVVEGVVVVDDFLHDLERESAELGRGAGAGERTRDSDVKVKIAEGCGAEPGGVVFDPFCGTDEGVFFGVPGGEDTVYYFSLRDWRGEMVGAYMLRRGFQPVFSNSPKALVISIRIALPEFGSAAPPMIQASR
jgi:hypothetical protein